MTEPSGRGPLDFDVDEGRDAAARATAAKPPPQPPQPQPPRATLPTQSRYVVLVAALLLLVVGYVSIRGHSTGVTARGLKAGAELPPFAAPLAAGSLMGDVDVAVRKNQGQAGRVPACELRGPQILNICQLYERGPVVLAFAVTGGPRCVRQLDTMERVRRRHPHVQFAAVALRGNRAVARRMLLAHRWSFPVGYDHDGALAPLYGVVVCPLTTFALPGGRVRSTTVGEMTAPQLDRQVRSLEAEAHRRGWAP